MTCSLQAKIDSMTCVYRIALLGGALLVFESCLMWLLAMYVPLQPDLWGWALAIMTPVWMGIFYFGFLFSARRRDG